MISVRILAAAVLASSGLVLSSPALAAPKESASVVVSGSNVMLVRERRHDRGRAHETGREWSRDRRGHDRRDWNRGGDRGYRSDRNRRTRRDWGQHVGRGRHYGWDRGRHRGWDRGRGHSGHGHGYHAERRRHARYHPRHGYWVGRRFTRVEYVVIHDYDYYYLPPPRRGQYYARVDNDVYLVAEATKRIIDAFVLLDAVGR